MSEKTNHQRRRFLGTAVMIIAAIKLVKISWDLAIVTCESASQVNEPQL